MGLRKSSVCDGVGAAGLVQAVRNRFWRNSAVVALTTRDSKGVELLKRFTECDFGFDRFS